MFLQPYDGAHCMPSARGSNTSTETCRRSHAGGDSPTLMGLVQKGKSSEELDSARLTEAMADGMLTSTVTGAATGVIPLPLLPESGKNTAEPPNQPSRQHS